MTDMRKLTPDQWAQIEHDLAQAEGLLRTGYNPLAYAQTAEGLATGALDSSAVIFGLRGAIDRATSGDMRRHNLCCQVLIDALGEDDLDEWQRDDQPGLETVIDLITQAQEACCDAQETKAPPDAGGHDGATEPPGNPANDG